MTAASERVSVFSCQGEQLLGIQHLPNGHARCGVLIVVGGPQYRVGSHRQFLLLARRLASEGYAVMRFDYRGMGDSTGILEGFEHIEPDLIAALAEFRRQQPGLERIVVWGLCDAASAALVHRALHPGVHALVLLNPWVTEGTVAESTLVKHYYLARLFSRGLWESLFRGEVKLTSALGGFARALVGRARRALSPARGTCTRDAGASTLSERMARGLEAFPGPVLLITSGKDVTAAEFLDRAGGSPRWRACLGQARIQHLHIEQANHTFSSAAWRAEVENATMKWLSEIEADAAQRT